MAASRQCSPLRLFITNLKVSIPDLRADSPSFSVRISEIQSCPQDLPKERPRSGAPLDTCGQEQRVLLAIPRCHEVNLERCQSSVSRNFPRCSLAAAQTREVPNKR